MGTPRSFQQNKTLPSGNSSVTFPLSPAGSAQRVRPDIHRHSHANTHSTPIQDRITSAESFDTARFSGTLNAPPNFQGNNNVSNDGMAANSVGQSPLSFSDHPISIPPRSLGERDAYNLSEGASVGEQSSPATASNYHYHWCWICPDYTSIKACGGFKRHIGEHFTRYYCIPPEAVITTEDGQRCALCGFPNPDPKHLNKHSLPGCVDKSYKRKKGLISHHIDKHPELDDSSVLANQSKYTKKKHFACGFCVFYCNSPEELANHVDAAHYKSLEYFLTWDCNKVMLGLLSQPIVSDHWRIARAAYPDVQESWFTWDSEQVKQLRNDMEDGRKPPADLVAAAIDQSNYGGSNYGHVEFMPGSSLTDPMIDNSQSIQGLQHQNALSPLPSIPEQSISTHASRMIVPPQSWDADLEDRQSPPITSETHGSPFSAMYPQSGHRPQPSALVNSGESFMERQRSAYVPLIRSASGTSQPLEGQRGTPYSSNLGGHSQGVSTNPTALPSSRRMAGAHNYPARPQTGWSHPSFQSAPSHLSQNSLTPPGGQFTIPYSPRHHPYLSPQCPRQETMDYRGTGMDADSDNTQRFMQDQDHTRAQR